MTDFSGSPFLSVQELERVALKGDISAVVQRLGGARDLRRVEFLVFVRRECRVHVRDECGDRQRIGRGICRAEKVSDRVACEIQPATKCRKSHQTRAVPNYDESMRCGYESIFICSGEDNWAKREMVGFT